MKAYLMYKDRDFELQQKLPANEQVLVQDLELDTLFGAMALGDKFLFDVAKKAVLSGTDELDAIRYRQDILKDCLKNAAVVRQIYDIAVEAIENEKKHYLSILSRYPGWILRRSVEVLQLFVGALEKLRNIADHHAGEFASAGFTALFAMIRKELDDEYLARVRNHLQELKFPYGIPVSAELGEGNEGTNYVLRRLPDNQQGWLQRLFAFKTSDYTIRIHERDEAGARALSDLKDRGINLVANALAQSADHILSFFSMLRIELAFYVGCLNLQGQLAEKGEPITFPLPFAAGERRFSCKGLYDVCLTLTMAQRVVGNDVAADGKGLVMVTGANQGGKSTFLRSVGLAQLMMQCGLFAPAEAFAADVCSGVFTHYKREEDAAMKSGKLDEELARMSDIVNSLRANSLLLFNESFAATNEREGSEIARQVVRALLESRVKVFFVTHLYEFAHSLHAANIENAIFLRAERQEGGGRTFRLFPGEPLPTSFGADLYNKIFGSNA